MVHAFVMVRTDVGQAADLLSVVRDLDRVSEAHVVAGTYDLIAEVDAGEMYQVLDAAATDLGALEGVVDTKTYVCLED